MNKPTNKSVVPICAGKPEQLIYNRKIARLLIANRGEIACRVIATAKKMGIKTIAIYSEADRHTKHVDMADHAVLIGKAPTQNSYLNIPNIISAAKETNADAIHPGYGFLSENAQFAEACQNNGLVFIGPPSKAMQAMSSKSEAKTIMEQAQIPLIPGYHGKDNSLQRLLRIATRIGYPVLLKAALGGGGKGMRIVYSSDEMSEAVISAKREALSSFGNDKLLIEKYLLKPRHIEVQIFADQFGNTIYLSDRDCSIQRRHQKIVEEAPAPNLSQSLRQAMGQAAVDAAKAIGYIGAGTVEFLLSNDDKFFFMEMNTRLQVEHPVTELITGQDLVEWQIKIAEGTALPFNQEQIQHQGHAIEVRIYAEDPNQDFIPSAGQILFLQEPKQHTNQIKVRVDSGIRQGDRVTSHYDPMLAKLIVWAENRELAVCSLSHALTGYRLIGLCTNIEYLQKVIRHPAFKQAKINTHFIEQFQADLKGDTSPACHLSCRSSKENTTEITVPKLTLFVAISAIVENFTTQENMQFPGWRLNHPPSFAMTVCRQPKDCYQYWFQFPYDTAYWEINNNYSTCTQQLQLTHITVNQKQYAITPQHIEVISANIQSQKPKHIDYHVEIEGKTEQFTVIQSDEQIDIFHSHWHEQLTIGHRANYQHIQDKETEAVAPLNGIITALHCQTGDTVAKDQPLLIIEAMKMEYTVRAPHAGTVANVFFAVGDQVEHGEQLVGFTTSN